MALVVCTTHVDWDIALEQTGAQDTELYGCESGEGLSMEGSDTFDLRWLVHCRDIPGEHVKEEGRGYSGAEETYLSTNRMEAKVKQESRDVSSASLKSIR